MLESSVSFLCWKHLWKTLLTSLFFFYMEICVLICIGAEKIEACILHLLESTKFVKNIYSIFKEFNKTNFRFEWSVLSSSNGLWLLNVWVVSIRLPHVFFYSTNGGWASHSFSPISGFLGYHKGSEGYRWKKCKYLVFKYWFIHFIHFHVFVLHVRYGWFIISW